MSKNEYAISLETNRLIKKNTPKYKRLLKLGKIKEIDKTEPPVSPKGVEPVKKEVKEVKKVEPDPKKDDFTEAKLQKELINQSVDAIQENMSKFVNSHKLTDEEMDVMIKRMLYSRLMGKNEKEKPKKSKTKKSKFKLRKVSSSESESE